MRVFVLSWLLVASLGLHDDESLVQQQSVMKTLQTADLDVGAQHTASVQEQVADKLIEKALHDSRDLRRQRQSGTQKTEDRLVANVSAFKELVEQHARLTDKLSRHNRHNWKAGHCSRICQATLAFDGLAMLGSVFGYQCKPFIFLSWWGMGMATLVLDQNLTLAESLLVLSQQSTTVGYGSHPPEEWDLQLFHGFHAWVGKLLVDPTMDLATNLAWEAPLKYLQDTFGSKIGSLVGLMIEFSLWSLIYTFDQRDADGAKQPFSQYLIDAFYMSAMTHSTVGYGDYAPASKWGMVLSPLFLQSATAAYEKWANSFGGEALYQEMSWSEEFKKWAGSCIRIN